MSQQLRRPSRPTRGKVLLAPLILGTVVALAATPPLHAHEDSLKTASSSAASAPTTSTTWKHLWAYNTLACLAGTMVLGCSAGVVGAFMLLRKRALVGDVVGHAALPGVAVAFLVMELSSPGSGKSMPGLLLGASLAGILGILGTLAIRHFTRIKEDAALAIVLSIFFGAGMVLLSIIQQVPSGSRAGLKDYIFGMASAIVLDDVWLIMAVAALALVVCGLFFKELTLLCFDEDFAATQGWPVVRLDILLMALVVCVAVVGMQSVGLLLVVALLIIPAAAARFWTDDLFGMTLISAAIGGVSAGLAVLPTAVYEQLATGPMIVLVGATFFLFSMFFGTRRGVLRRVLIHWQLKFRVGRRDLLRALYECAEDTMEDTIPAATGSKDEAILAQSVPMDRLLDLRSWTPARLRKLLAAAARDRLVQRTGDRTRLTRQGLAEARRVIRNHRLWELYLTNYADIAPSHVERDADSIEHILDAALLRELEKKLSEQHPDVPVPPSPHAMGG